MSIQAEASVHLADQSGGHIRRLRAKWVEAFNRRRVDDVIGFYAEDAMELPLNGGPAASGIIAIREAMKSTLAAGFAEMKLRQTQVSCTEPLGVELATYTVRLLGGIGTFGSETGRLVATWRREENGEFKIRNSVWSREWGDDLAEI